MRPVFLLTPLVLPVLAIRGAWGILPCAEVLIVREKVLSVSITSGEWSVVKYSEFATFATVTETQLPLLFIDPGKSGTKITSAVCVGGGPICNDAERRC